MKYLRCVVLRNWDLVNHKSDLVSLVRRVGVTCSCRPYFSVDQTCKHNHNYQYLSVLRNAWQLLQTLDVVGTLMHISTLCSPSMHIFHSQEKFQYETLIITFIVHLHTPSYKARGGDFVMSSWVYSICLAGNNFYVRYKKISAWPSLSIDGSLQQGTCMHSE